MRFGLLLVLTACATPLSSDFSGVPFFTLAGPVELTDGTSDGVTYAAIAWGWTDGASLATVGSQVPFDPQVFNYELTVPGPPSLTATSSGTALDEIGDHAMLFGVPLLLTAIAPVDPVIDPNGLAAWIRGTPTAVPDWIDVPDGRVLAWTDEHLLVALSTTEGLSRLGDDPTLDVDAACTLVEAEPGLTLYQRPRADDCTPWTPLAPAGERTSFQGVTMRSP